MSATKKTFFESTVQNNKVRAFGFRAIHAWYYSTGEFFSFGQDEEGSAIPLYGVNMRVRTLICDWIWEGCF
jgi:hypothetical protein